MDPEQTYEKIERYLRGELAGEELAEFEAQLESDADLRQELKLAEELDVVLADEEGMAFSRLLAEADANYFAAQEGDASAEQGQDSETGGDAEESPAPGRSRKHLFRIWMPLAASLVLLATFLLIQYSGTANDPAKLYGEYFETYQAPQAYRGNDSLLSARFATAFDDYKQGNYEPALAAFAAILQDQPGDPMAALYAGLSAHALGRYTEAEAYLEPQASGEWQAYRQAARWYLALNHLKQSQASGDGDQQAAEKWLEMLAQEKGKFGGQARELLDALD